jgi:hypothetical protein
MHEYASKAPDFTEIWRNPDKHPCYDQHSNTRSQTAWDLETMKSTSSFSLFTNYVILEDAIRYFLFSCLYSFYFSMLSCACCFFWHTHKPEDGVSTFLRNVGKLLPDSLESQPSALYVAYELNWTTIASLLELHSASICSLPVCLWLITDSSIINIIWPIFVKLCVMLCLWRFTPHLTRR